MVCTNSKVQGIKAQKRKRWKHQEKLSLHVLSKSCLDGLAIVQTKLSSSLYFLLHEFKLACSLSKITPFLTSHISQYAVTVISLKILLPKASLAVITMSRGCRFMFHWMGMEFQHDTLKGHSKNRWKSVSSCPVLEHNFNLQGTYFFSSKGFWYWVCL